MPATTHHFQHAYPIILAAVLLCVCAAPVAAAAEPDPVLIFYSRGGTTRTVVQAISAGMPCRTIEIRSQLARTGLKTFTCVLDQLLDRDDDPVPLERPVPPAGDLIIACPIWIHRLASPMRTFLQRHDLGNRPVHLVLTHQGNFGQRDIAGAEALLRDCGLRPVATYAIHTRGLTPPQLFHQACPIVRQLRASLQPD